jgi:hypothetical protein
VRLPLEEISRVQCVRPKLKQSTETARRGGGPERELLHQRSPLALNQALEFAIELTELWVLRDVVERVVVAFVTLVFPDVDYLRTKVSAQKMVGSLDRGFTKGVVVTDLRPPAAYQVDTVLLSTRHAGVPLAHQVHIFINLVGLDVVHNDRMDIFAAC